MADGPRAIIIVGANIAGASAAETLRRRGYDGRLTLVGAESELPYERPPLSKTVLTGVTAPQRVILRPADYYAEQRIELYLGRRAVRLHAAAGEIELDRGERLAFDQLLIATGSAPRRVSVPGADLPGVTVLRTLADARALIAAFAYARAHDGHVVIIGAGFIGMEVAAACRRLGLPVTVIEQLAAPLQRALGTEVGDVFARVQRARGVQLRLGEGVAAFRGVGRVEEVETSDGTKLPCDLALVAVGVSPAQAWLEGSGVALRDGVLVDAYCATMVPGVFAAGDVARWPYRPAGATQATDVRVEHWDNALRQAEIAARNMLGERVPYAPVPYFWSDQDDLKLQVAGYESAWEQVVMRGDPAAGTFLAFYLRDTRVRMALAVNQVREFLALKKIVAAGASIAPKLLADAGVEVRALAAQLPRA